MTNYYSKSLTSKANLVKNTLWNLASKIVPLIVGVFAIPVLIENIGTERFGILTLATMLVGYFGLFDFGLGRAQTKLISECLGREAYDELPGIFWASQVIITLIGILGVIVLFCITPFLITSLLNVSEKFWQESILAFRILAFTLPFVILSRGLQGSLRAVQRFDLITKIRVPIGVWNFVGPLLILPFSYKISFLVLVICIGRITGCFLFLWKCLKVLPIRYGVDWKVVNFRNLLMFSGWISVSNIISPIMEYLDRFFIGAILSMDAVAFYTTPYEVLNRIRFIPNSIIGVLFPALGFNLVADRKRGLRLIKRSMGYMLIIAFPITLVFVVLAPEGISFWINPSFAVKSAPVMQILAIGIFINSMARLFFSTIQADGRADITAKFHMIELVMYVFLLYILLIHFGIIGAAIAWTARVALDAILLFSFAIRLIPDLSSLLKPSVYGSIILGIAFILGGILHMSITNKLIYLAVILFLFGLYSWFFILHTEDKKWLLNSLRIKVA